MTEKMRFEGLTLTVDSVERSIAFYQGLLGLDVAWNAAPAFAMIRIGAGTIGLLSAIEARKEGVEDATTSSSAQMISTGSTMSSWPRASCFTSRPTTSRGRGR